MKMLTWLGVAILTCACGNALAQKGSHADSAIGRQLDSLDYTYEVDEDGDYQMVFDMEDGRSQLVYVRSAIENYGSLSVREIWSPGFRIKGGDFPAVIANRLLSDSNSAKIGSWVRQDEVAMYVVKIDANASADQLSDAIDAAIKTADKLEQELTLGADEF
jgi:hypothetical protein